MDFLRRNTTGLTNKTKVAKDKRRRRTDSFKNQSKQKQEEEQPKLPQVSYPIYNGLTWEQIKNYLENRYPGYTFEKKLVCLKTLNYGPLDFVLYAHVDNREGTAGSLKPQSLGNLYVLRTFLTPCQ